ncbi:MAG: hypothetical protein GX605_12720 [Chloroflexi bacterium]|nr:hypothetical protein [Chloroflexota bacterium]
MNCGETALGLATPRDLNAHEQAEISAHLERCPACRAAAAAFAQQDELLAAMPTASLSPALRERVWGRIHPRRRWAWAWQPLATAALLALVAIGAVGGAVHAAGEAIPGDTLYPIKRFNEQVQWAFSWDELSRDRLRAEQAEQRRQEARKVLALGRQTVWQFEGLLESASDGAWVVGGLSVTFCSDKAAPPGVASGSHVRLTVLSLGSEICALEAQALHGPAAAPTQTATAAASPAVSATPSAAPSASPTASTAPSDAPAKPPREAPGRQAPATAPPTQPPRQPGTPTATSSATPLLPPTEPPGHGRPTSLPSFTPNPPGPPGPSATPHRPLPPTHGRPTQPSPTVLPGPPTWAPAHPTPHGPWDPPGPPSMPGHGRDNPPTPPATDAPPVPPPPTPQAAGR